MDVWNFVANKTGDVSVGGHIGGAVVGLTLGLFIMENFFVSRFDNIMKYVGLGKCRLKILRLTNILKHVLSYL